MNRLFPDGRDGLRASSRIEDPHEERERREERGYGKDDAEGLSNPMVAVPR